MHTPGPWGIEKTQGDRWIGPMRAGGEKIETVVVRVDYSENYIDEAKEQIEANARLIAAAPELLEMCRAVVDCDDTEDTEYAMILEKLHAVIRKATRE